MVTGRLRQRSWETPEGNKRSVTKIEAEEVGASLKWATAKVERTSQRGNGERARVESGRLNVAATSATNRRSDYLLLRRPRFQAEGASLARRAGLGLNWEPLRTTWPRAPFVVASLVQPTWRLPPGRPLFMAFSQYERASAPAPG
jgi:hypothetical protein